MKKCNKCDFENNKEAEFCENCGNSLTVISTVEETETNFCPECGEKLELNSVFCSKCGHSFGTKCRKCKTTNVSDAKFCENCSEPLEWICPICKNKNQAGAMFCSECGSDSIIGKTKKWKILSAVAVVLIIVGFIGINISQFNTSIDKAISYGDDNDFNSANTFLRTAQNSWLPFTDSKIQKTKNYINSQEEKCLLLAQQQREQEEQRKKEARAKKASSARKSSSKSNRNYSSSSSNKPSKTSDWFYITVKNNGFLVDNEIDNYTVIITRTSDLQGNIVYDSADKQVRKTYFIGSSNIEYIDKPYGYYTVEYFGFDKLGNKLFNGKYGNILHKCVSYGTFYTDGSTPRIDCY